MSMSFLPNTNAMSISPIEGQRCRIQLHQDFGAGKGEVTMDLRTHQNEISNLSVLGVQALVCETMANRLLERAAHFRALAGKS